MRKLKKEKCNAVYLIMITVFVLSLFWLDGEIAVKLRAYIAMVSSVFFGLFDKRYEKMFEE